MSFDSPASPFRSMAANRTAYDTVVGTTSIVLFPEVPNQGIVQRVIHNPDDTLYLAVKLSPAGWNGGAQGANTAAADPAVPGSGPAAVNTGGSITIPPFGTVEVAHTGQIQVIGSGASAPVTAYER